MHHLTHIWPRVALAVGLSLSSAGFGAEVRTVEPFVGVKLHQIVQTPEMPATPDLPRPVVIHLFEIDVTAPGVRFEMSPGNGDAPGEIRRETTRAFVDRVGAQIGINVGFYDTRANYGDLNTDLMHLAASRGEVYSPAGGEEYVFDVPRDGLPRIGKADGTHAATVEGIPVYNAAGGNQPILDDGKVVAPPDSSYTKALNPHTAVAISQDRKRVFLMVVDGRQSGYSEGMRTDEMGHLLLKYGAWDAVNFDGGGSTTMVVDDTFNQKQDARVLNSPSDFSSPSKPGNERVVANNLAVFATPKPGYVPLSSLERPNMEAGLELLKTHTVIEPCEDITGRFSNRDDVLGASGSNRNVLAASTATLDLWEKRGGNGSLRLEIASDPAGGETILRLLSNDASPKNNTIGGKAMGNDGFVGVWLRREKSDTPLYVSLVVDEGTPSAVATERGKPLMVKADGEWHLYQWGLNEDAKWFNYNGGNGKIDGPNVFIDSLLFRTGNDDEKGTPFQGSIWIDELTFNPDALKE